MLAVVASSLLFVVATPSPSPKVPPPTVVVAEPIDPGTVQSIDVVEVVDDPSCPGLIDRDRRFCGRGRRFELRRGTRERAIALLQVQGAPRACAERPTHAFLVHTTKGPRVVTVSFRCKTIGGRAFVGTAEQEAAALFRAQGLVHGL